MRAHVVRVFKSMLFSLEIVYTFEQRDGASRVVSKMQVASAVMCRCGNTFVLAGLAAVTAIWDMVTATGTANTHRRFVRWNRALWQKATHRDHERRGCDRARARDQRRIAPGVDPGSMRSRCRLFVGGVSQKKPDKPNDLRTITKARKSPRGRTCRAQ